MMRQKVRGSIVVLAAVTGASLAGPWYRQHGTTENGATTGPKVLRYMDPMHPAYISDQPGIAPDCGMALVPVYADRRPDEETGRPPAPAGTVQVSEDRQQLIGVRVGTAETASATDTLRVVGRVAPDDTRVYKLVAGAEGFIREVSTVTTGSRVRKDQWLATFSAPESRAPIQSYLVTLGVLDRARPSGADAPAQIAAAESSTEQAVDRLLNLGMSRHQIEEIRQTRQVATSIKILAPADGVVQARDVAPGQTFERGTEWYRIADLSRVWILAVVSESDAAYFGPGKTVRVSLPHERRAFEATVSSVLPQSDPNTPTVKVRLEAPNPGHRLRPDMLVDVELPIELPLALTVPADAIVDSGRRQVVYVATGEGVFQPRRVETGWRAGDRVQIVKGLVPGERIVVSGTFLIDSESKMRTAAAGIYGETSRDSARRP